MTETTVCSPYSWEPYAHASINGTPVSVGMVETVEAWNALAWMIYPGWAVVANVSLCETVVGGAISDEVEYCSVEVWCTFPFKGKI